ncbi:hypothetical protein Tco_1238578 [Tanacetum coccineum]
MGVTLSGSQELASPRVNGYLVKASSNPLTFFDLPLPGVNTPWDVMRIVCNPKLMVFHVAEEVTICVVEELLTLVFMLSISICCCKDIHLIYKVWSWFHVAVVQSSGVQRQIYLET